jgi:hypothetical protein
MLCWINRLEHNFANSQYHFKLTALVPSPLREKVRMRGDLYGIHYINSAHPNPLQQERERKITAWKIWKVNVVLLQ